MVVEGTLQPASQPLEGVVSSDNLGSTQQCFGSHFIALVSIEGHTYLCDVGAGPKGLAEPMLLQAYDDTDSSSSSSPTQQPPPADWLDQQGESQQYGLRYRLRRGIMGSAEPLSTAAALTHRERDSFVGYYLQVRQAPTQCDCECRPGVCVCAPLSALSNGTGRLSLQGIGCCCLAARAESFSQRRCYTPDAPSVLPSPPPKKTCSTLSRARGGTCTGSTWRR